MVTLEAEYSTPSSSSKKAKRHVVKATFEKRQRELEKKSWDDDMVTMQS